MTGNKETEVGTKGAVYRRTVSTHYKERLHRELCKHTRLPINGCAHMHQGWKVKVARPAGFTLKDNWSMKPWATETLSKLIRPKIFPTDLSIGYPLC